MPGDKSISHRALLMALLARGESRITGAGDGRDVQASAGICAALGATVVRSDGGAARDRAGAPGAVPNVDYRIVSPGHGDLGEPARPLDCMNSGTSLRLVAGIVAGASLFAILDGDESLRSRPMGRIATPLAAMGAVIAGRHGATLPPLAITGRRPLCAIDHATLVPSAQVKSCVLLAGLAAEGTTTVREAILTRDHTERMLRARGVEVRTFVAADGSAVHSVEGGAHVRPCDQRVPGDISSAAFWLAAGAIHPDAELTVRDVGTNPSRRGIIDLLRRMGADIVERPVGEDASSGTGEPIADLVVRSSSLRGIDVRPDEVAAAIDEVPVLCLAAAVATGKTIIRGAGELRNKESDRIAGIVDGLTALGARVTVEADDILIEGGRALRGASVATQDDHRLAMTFAVAGLIAEGETRIAQSGAADVSYPGFFAELERVCA
jgi:3-phosphoshikimate 1-carboxyvinyltransferase